MLLLLILWTIATVVILTIGDFFISIFNALTKKKEQYSIIDTFVLGVCFILFPLGITSIWLPSNESMLLAYIVFSIGYWIIRRDRVKVVISEIKNFIAELSISQILLMAGTAAAFLTMTVWASYFFDAVNYQYQMTTWYEQYCAVPGLVNIESRLGFNSNYFLLSALFSLQSRLDEPIFIIQSLFTAFFACWIMLHIIRSNYEIKGLILLLLFSLFVGINMYALTTSSTDILPSLFVFYLASKLLLYPDTFHKKYLLFFIVPFCLVTIKLSVAPIIILSVYIAYILLKQKDYRSVTVLCILGLTIVCPWLIRNVIVSGYLIYPLPAIDLFNFDWKAPALVAQLEQDYIKDYGWHEFWINSTMLAYRVAYKVEGLLARNKLNLIFASITLLISIIAYLAPFVMGYNFFKKKKVNSIHYLLGISLVAIILLWFSAPDFRFISGTIFGAAFLVIVFSIKTNRYFPIIGKLCLILFVGIMVLSSAKRTMNYYYETKNNGATREFSSILYKPYGIKAQRNININDFRTYKIGQRTIYISPDKLENASYDYLPCTFILEPAEATKGTMKFYPIQGIEPRGTKMKDGFRPIKEYDEQKWRRERDWWTKKQLTQKAKDL